MGSDAVAEREWWSGHNDEEARRNAWGDPPYDVEAVAQRIVECLQPRPGERILDLGCGPGRTARAVSALARAWVIGVDISPHMLELAGDDGFTEYHLGDGRMIPPCNFDHAYSVTMFEHIPHEATRSYIQQIHDRLPVGGRFIFSHTPGDDPQSFLHHQCVVMDVWDWLDEAGFGGYIPIASDPSLDEEVWQWFCVEKK